MVRESRVILVMCSLKSWLKSGDLVAIKIEVATSTKNTLWFQKAAESRVLFLVIGDFNGWIVGYSESLGVKHFKRKDLEVMSEVPSW